MVAEWFYEADGKQFGPVTAPQLKQLAVNGFLQPTHLIWKEGLQKKVPARSVKGLFAEPPQGAAPAPAASGRPAPAAAPPAPAPAVPRKKPTPPAEEPLETLEPVDQLETVEAVDQLETLEAAEELETLEPADEPLETLESVEEEEAELEAVEGPPGEAAAARAEPDPADVLAEIQATYRGGHPKLEAPIEGTLYLETTGLWFTPVEGRPLRMAFADVENLLEPAKGDFPEAAKSSAQKAKLAAGAGKLVSGLAGNFLGGWGGKALKSAGKTASEMAGGDLGKPPRNRLTIVARVGQKRHKISFDTLGPTRPEMEDDARTFFKQMQKTCSNPPAPRKQTAIASGTAVRTAPAVGGTGAWAPAPAVAGKPFRVLRNGQPQGPYSLDEVRRMLDSGQLGALDLIGVEMWLPIAGMGGLLLGMGGAGEAAVGGAAAGGAGGTVTEDEAAAAEEAELEEIEDEPPAQEEKAPAPADDAPLPVDEDL